MKNTGYKIKGKSKCDMLVEEIISLIASNVYKSGDKLPSENEFAEQFGLSRVTVRESFKMLSMMGIVSIRQGEGTFVNSLDIGSLMRPLLSLVVFDKLSIEQLFDARIAVEMGTVSLATRNRTEEDLEVLREITEKMEIAVNQSNIDDFTELDTRFHMKIGEASGNFVLLATYSMIKDILKYFMAQSSLVANTMENSLAHHKIIIGLIKARNEAAAGPMMKKHIQIAKKALLSLMENEGRG